MDSLALGKIRHSRTFQELERKRSRLSWTLCILMMVIYGGFVLLAALEPSLMAQQIGHGVITLAFPVGLGVMAAAVLLTGFYVVRANTEFDRLTREIVREVQAGSSAGLAGDPP